jgi:hypothetical protein
MTEDELEMFRLKVRVEALRVLVRGLYTGLANSSPNGGQAVRERFAALRAKHSKVVISGIAPEYSDMLASEYEEALEDLLKYIESGLS